MCDYSHKAGLPPVYLVWRALSVTAHLCDPYARRFILLLVHFPEQRGAEDFGKKQSERLCRGGTETRRPRGEDLEVLRGSSAAPRFRGEVRFFGVHRRDEERVSHAA